MEERRIYFSLSWWLTILLLLAATEAASLAGAFQAGSLFASRSVTTTTVTRRTRRSPAGTTTTTRGANPPPVPIWMVAKDLSTTRSGGSGRRREEMNILWANDDEDEDDENNHDSEVEETSNKKRRASRWDSLHPRIKARIIKKGQERAIANKMKRESPRNKKRRIMMYYKEKQREKKRASRVKRPIPFGDRGATPLSALVPGMEMTGIVISLTKFGAYVDVGTECDGLLHISQMSTDFFIESPRQVVSPGDEVVVRVRSTNPLLKKLHLSMLSKEQIEDQLLREEELATTGNNSEGGDGDENSRIPLEDISVDDELWGELVRVTDYGAYVEVGAVVDGFLHFMDHPAFGWNKNGEHPTEFMARGDRVRVWVSDVDFQRNRIKLTANRPQHLPGPKREL